MRFSRIQALIYKEWREILRDRLYSLMTFGVPAITLIVLGYGISTDVERIPFAVLDGDQSTLSREYLHRFMDSRYFDFQGEATDTRVLDTLLADSRIRFALIIPPQFQRDLLAGRSVAVQSLIDGIFPYRAQVNKGYVSAINAHFSTWLLENYLMERGFSQAAARRTIQPVRLEIRALYNQAVRSRWSMGSGLIMLVLMFSPPFLTALGIVREKENGSIYNIYASPVSSGEFLLGKLLPYVFLSSINVFLLWALATGLFGTPFKGNPWFFLGASFLFVTCTTGIGLLISLLARTQAAAAILAMVLTFIPAILYSGLLVPVESMDAATRSQAQLFPGVYYLQIVWGSFLKGLGWSVLWDKVALLGIYALIVWTLGLHSFHKRPKR